MGQTLKASKVGNIPPLQINTFLVQRPSFISWVRNLLESCKQSMALQWSGSWEEILPVMCRPKVSTYKKENYFWREVVYIQACRINQVLSLSVFSQERKSYFLFQLSQEVLQPGITTQFSQLYLQHKNSSNNKDNNQKRLRKHSSGAGERGAIQNK